MYEGSDLNMSTYEDHVTNTSVLEYFSFIKKKKSNKIQLYYNSNETALFFLTPA